MKVLELKTKGVIDVNDGYGERLIQHGMAVLPPRGAASDSPNQPSAVSGNAGNLESQGDSNLMPHKEPQKKAQKEQPPRKGDA